MPEYKAPGVFIEESNAGPRPIEGVSTTTAAFIGFAPTGPENTPVFIANWQQYCQQFGALDASGIRDPFKDDYYLAPSVYAFFNNGGTRCYVVRLVPQANPAGKKTLTTRALKVPGKNSNAVSSLSIVPKGDLTSDIVVDIQLQTAEVKPDSAKAKDAPVVPETDEGNEVLFSLKVTRGGVQESFEKLSMSKKNPRNVADVVNRESALITVDEVLSTGAILDRNPAAGQYLLQAEQANLVQHVSSDDFRGDLARRSGIDGLEIAEDVTMISVPDLMGAYQRGQIDLDGVKGVQRALIDHCERVGNRMALLDTPPDLTPQQVRDWRNVEVNFDTSCAAMYYPWITVDGAGGKPLNVPPSGFIAGIIARTDIERGVHKAPANVVVRGALRPTSQISKSEQEILNPIGVNCIREFPGLGVRVWGARTLSSDARWRYVPVRRLFNFVERSLERGTQWAVFEPNDEDLWFKVRRDISNFLTIVWRDGALFGLTPREAFYVKCDAELNPPEVRDVGIMQVEIAMAPVKPAEFVVMRFSQYAGGGQ